MIAIARYLRVATSLELQVRLQYRAGLWIWSLASILQIVVALSVWRGVAHASSGSVGGYDARSFVSYFLVLLFVREMTYTGVPWRFEDWVRDGDLASKLLLPRHPLLFFFASDIGFRIISALVIVPAALLLYRAFDGTHDGTLASFALMLVLLPLATITRLLTDSIVACAALWFVRIEGVRGMYYLVMLFLGGQFAPLSVLPHWAEAAAKLFPFYWTLGFPVEVAIGRVSTQGAPAGAAVLACWMVGAWLVLRVVWERGVRAHEAVGQ